MPGAAKIVVFHGQLLEKGLFRAPGGRLQYTLFQGKSPGMTPYIGDFQKCAKTAVLMEKNGPGRRVRRLFLELEKSSCFCP
jgi:hypothetical protein